MRGLLGHMTLEEFCNLPMKCDDCGRTEIIDRWQIMGSSCDDNLEEDDMPGLPPGAQEDEYLMCRHCYNWQKPPKFQKTLFD